MTRRTAGVVVVSAMVVAVAVVAIGGLSNAGTAPTRSVAPPVAAEDNGSFATAVDTRLKPGGVVRATGTIGDGPHGTAGDRKGDFDFYVIHGVTSGQMLCVLVDTPGSDLHPTVQYWTEADVPGVASQDRGSALLARPVEGDGDAVVSIGGAGSQQADPDDSGSGDGARSEGTYTVTFALEAADTDRYAVTAPVTGQRSRRPDGGRCRQLTV